MAQLLDLRLLSGILQTGAVVGLLALVVIFQPELRRALERIGRVGSLGWAFAPSGAAGLAEGVARTLARTASLLSASRTGRAHRHRARDRPGGRRRDRRDAPCRPERGAAGVDLRAPDARSMTAPSSSARGRVLAAGAVLPLSEISIDRERTGTRHRAADGHHRADRCHRHRGQRGDRVGQPGPARPDPARPGRGAACGRRWWRCCGRPTAPSGPPRASPPWARPFVRGKRPAGPAQAPQPGRRTWPTAGSRGWPPRPVPSMPAPAPDRRLGGCRHGRGPRRRAGRPPCRGIAGRAGDAE